MIETIFSSIGIIMLIVCWSGFWYSMGYTGHRKKCHDNPVFMQLIREHLQ